MLFADWEVRIVKNCDRSLENAARGRRQTSITMNYNIVMLIYRKIQLNIISFFSCSLYHKYMLFARWEIRTVKNCDRGLENAARGRRPRQHFQVRGHSFSLYGPTLSR